MTDELDGIAHEDDIRKIRYNLTCPKCYRVYKDFIPLPDKESLAVVWCRVCNVVLGRFDWGKKEYSELDNA